MPPDVIYLFVALCNNYMQHYRTCGAVSQAHILNIPVNKLKLPKSVKNFLIKALSRRRLLCLAASIVYNKSTLCI